MTTQLLARWTGFVIRYPRSVLAVLALITVAAGWIAVDRFSMNSDTGRLIRQETQWRANHDAFMAGFPQYDQNTFVVISGHRPAQVVEVARALTAKLRQRDDVLRSVFSPVADSFVDEHALLFMDMDDLEDTVSRLADAQPFLAAIQQDGLPGVLSLVQKALNTDEPLPSGFLQMTNALDLAANRALHDPQTPIIWRDELFNADTSETWYQVIFVQGQQDFGQDLPNGLIIGSLRETLAAFEHPARQDVQIRLSGQVPLEHAEIESALDSARFAGTLALVLLILVLTWGVQSLRIIAATYLAMLCGLVWTAAFAMLTVGQYNTISIIFLVMFIGLGVDFAVHLCLKYQEYLSPASADSEAGVQASRSAALIDTGVELGPAIMLCGLTSAIGFLAFVPTDYVGLAEMGIISGGGMIIAVLVSLTLIPAFFAVTRTPRPGSDLPFSSTLSTLTVAHYRLTAGVTLGLLVVLLLIASQARFDYSTLSLKDPDSEAMQTLQELHDQDIITDYSLMFVADNTAQAASLAAQLLALPEVSTVRTPDDYLPTDQAEKLLILEDAGFFLESLYMTPSDPGTDDNDDELKTGLKQVASTIETYLAGADADPAMRASLTNLSRSLAEIASADRTFRDALETLVVPPIRAEIAWIGRAIAVGPVSLADLPADLRARLIDSDGREVVAITPAEDVVPVDAMRRFTTAVMKIMPEATGRPVLDLGIGEIVIRAFATAISIAVAAIFVILLVTLRSVVDAVLVFIPLAMTALATLAFSVLADLPLNMANVVVIPLIFGLGVDNGIHIVKRFHQSRHVAELVNSSTPKAVFLSNLTTLGTFFALVFSTHQGIYSIGILLTVALVCLMTLTLVSLPALLAAFSHPRGARA